MPLSESPPKPDQGQTRNAIIFEMQRVVPRGRQELDPETKQRLRQLTATLAIVDKPNAEAEYARFIGVRNRALKLPEERLQETLRSKTILVTGGTGCIGSTLLRELTQYAPARIVNVSRGRTIPWQKIPGVDYANLDIRDGEGIKDLVGAVKPDIIYHLAAQRDPSLAERAVNETLSTNIFGTRNIIDAARQHNGPQVVYASTGKALRPYTPDTYAASKKVGEGLMANFAAEGTSLVSGARFTHVVDNSIIHNRTQRWIDTDSPIRLHGTDILFYMQSAKESVQLLLNCGLEAERGKFTLQTIRDLEWPVNLVDLAVGEVLARKATTPIYFCGYEEGYEENPYPQLYDPMLAGEISPLISAFEASQATSSLTCPQVDVFPFEIATDPEFIQRLQDLEQVCAGTVSKEVLHNAQEAVSWALLDARLQKVPQDALQRLAQRVERERGRYPILDEHEKTNQAIYRELRNPST